MPVNPVAGMMFRGPLTMMTLRMMLCSPLHQSHQARGRRRAALQLVEGISHCHVGHDSIQRSSVLFCSDLQTQHCMLLQGSCINPGGEAENHRRGDYKPSWLDRHTY
jgi:hypothetical protein